MMKIIVSSSLVGLVRRQFAIRLRIDTHLNLGVGDCPDDANERLLYDAIMSKNNLLSETSTTPLQLPAYFILALS